ncbi:unnamed protein product [Spirodela intermedia]|uniref:O-fucosyltransferase family protein n=2 Tax=Spirodela intermedia TaxID=51605 RepID=A0A7I8KCT1_SPIIN|nr:unnamed protein product [Spirodela intermedia]CAA6658738.1 unnamed protein product [Spirodela intermedia]CAA7395024.1 unnamed protein product [Spirodela intermedia]
MHGITSEDLSSRGFGHSSSSPSLLLHQQPQAPPPLKPLWSQLQQSPPRARLHLYFIRACMGILVLTCLIQLVTVGQIWHRPRLPNLGGSRGQYQLIGRSTPASNEGSPGPVAATPPILPARIYKSNGYLEVSCNGGLNQMRAAICDMTTIARFLNLTLVVPELDKKSFWADPSDFADIFNVSNFINSLRDEVRIIKRLPRRIIGKGSPGGSFMMPPVSWSNETYYLTQILPLFGKYEVIHFNKTDARLANNGLPIELQRLRCRVNYQALRFTDQIESLGNKLVQILQAKGYFVALHLRYEMDMLAFSGCTHGCSDEEAEMLKRMRYAYPWWREKEIASEKKRLEGLCPLTPEEAALILQALGFGRETQIYIAAGEIFASELRLKALKAAFPQLVRKEMLLDPEDLKQFQNHSSQMAALDYMVSIASDVFIPTYNGNMAKVVEGHRRYLGYRKSILLDRRELVRLLDLFQNQTLSWDEFANGVQVAHMNRMGKPSPRNVIPNKPKEEDNFYANPWECLRNPS